MERLEAIATPPLQRLGLSAPQRPLDEVARFLGGSRRRSQTRVRPGSDRGQSRVRAEDAETAIHDEFSADRASPNYRPVTIVDTSQKKKLELTIEVPVEDMARMGESDPSTSSGSSRAGSRDEEIP